jgi:thymidine phosphorylase
MSAEGCHQLHARRLGIETLQQADVYIRSDSAVCRAEGLAAHNSVLVSAGARSVVATLHPVTGDFLALDEIGLSEWAWQVLALREHDAVSVKHAPQVESLSHVRSKVFGHRLTAHAFDAIIDDITRGTYSNIQLSEFVTACAAIPLDRNEMRALTAAMIRTGERVAWESTPIMDKHSIGGLAGNRTTPIVVSIVATCGLTIPKTSSRSITSPAGTADTMETLAPVDLTIGDMRKVVEREGGCIVWGGAMRLSPSDDILIRIERVLDLDAEGQMVASILSKKIAAGATHLVLDLPVGPTAKIRSIESARALSTALMDVGQAFGLHVRILHTDGTQPVGRGIGPALEARDVLAVLQNAHDAPADLRERAELVAGAILELGGLAREGHGMALAATTLASGAAWTKFQRICEAQGGMRVPPVARQTQSVLAARTGVIDRIDNRRLSRLAKLAGAPEDKAAGLVLHERIGSRVVENQPLYTIHAESKGDIDYALDYARSNPDIIGISPS